MPSNLQLTEGNKSYTVPSTENGSPTFPVANYQNLVNTRYGTNLAVDGVWGQQTQEAYQQLAQDNNPYLYKDLMATKPVTPAPAREHVIGRSMYQGSLSYPAVNQEATENFYSGVEIDGDYNPSNYSVRDGDGIMPINGTSDYRMFGADAGETNVPQELVSPYAIEGKNFLFSKLKSRGKNQKVVVNKTKTALGRPMFDVFTEEPKKGTSSLSSELASKGLSLGWQTPENRRLMEQAKQKRLGMFEQDTVITPEAVRAYAFKKQPVYVGNTVFKPENKDLEKFTKRMITRYSSLRNPKKATKKVVKYAKGGEIEVPAEDKIIMLNGKTAKPLIELVPEQRVFSRKHTRSFVNIIKEDSETMEYDLGLAVIEAMKNHDAMKEEDHEENETVEQEEEEYYSKAGEKKMGAFTIKFSI